MSHGGYITHRNLLAVTSGREFFVAVRLTSLLLTAIAVLAVPATAAAQGQGQGGEKADPAGGAAIGEVVLATAMASWCSGTAPAA